MQLKPLLRQQDARDALPFGGVAALRKLGRLHGGLRENSQQHRITRRKMRMLRDHGIENGSLGFRERCDRSDGRSSGVRRE